MANNRRSEDEVVFKLVSRIGVLADYQTGWSKEINIVAWNEGIPKYDIRDWNPEHDRMSKGITLHEEEAKKLAEVLYNRFFGKGNERKTIEAESDRTQDVPAGGSIIIEETTPARELPEEAESNQKEKAENSGSEEVA